MKRALFALFALAPLGCPEAPSDLENSQPGDPGGGGEGGMGAPLGPSLTMPTDDPTHSQEDLAADPDAVTVSGSLVCEDGEGPFRIRLFVPPPEEGGPAEGNASPSPPGPLVLLEIAEPGPFTLKSPKSEALKVLAYEDADKSGAPTPDEAQFSTTDGALLNTTTDVADVSLDCSLALPSPAPLTTPMPGADADTPPGAAPPENPPPTGDGPEGANAAPPAGPPPGEIPDGVAPPPTGDAPPSAPPPPESSGTTE